MCRERDKAEKIEYAEESAEDSIPQKFYVPRKEVCMSKLNCWEYKNCTGKAGACPALTAEKFDGVNSGKNGGRICWYCRATLTDRKERGPQAVECARCGFYSEVEKDEGSKFIVFF